VKSLSKRLEQFDEVEKLSYRLPQTALVSFKPEQNNKKQFMALFCW